MLRIFEKWPFSKDLLLTGEEPDPEEVDPEVMEIQARIDRVLKDPKIREHLRTQIEIYEGYMRDRYAESDKAYIVEEIRAARLDEKQREKLISLVENYGRQEKGSAAVHETPEDFGPIRTGKAPSTTSGPAGADSTSPPDGGKGKKPDKGSA